MSALPSTKARSREPRLLVDAVRSVWRSAHPGRPEAFSMQMLAHSAWPSAQGVSSSSRPGAGTPFHAPVRRWLLFGLLGLGLGLGAPLGWLLLRLLGPVSWSGLGAELWDHLGLYSYLTLGTALAFGLFGAMLGALADRLADINAHLTFLAVTDALTGLKNKGYFHERLRSEVERAQRESRPLALVLVDLDHFKSLNDRRGHAVGDKALVHAAQVLQLSLRTSDVACRVGGEEFAIICPGPALGEARMVAERVRQAMESAQFQSEARDVPERLTASIGVAVLRTSADALFRAADSALYAAKRGGRNQVVVESPTLVQPPQDGTWDR